MRPRANPWWQLASILLLLGLWQVAAGIADSRVLPAPMEVFVVLGEGLASGELPYHLVATLARVAASFVLAMSIGIAVGIAMGRLPALDRFLDSWLVLFLNLPALVTIILCYVWFGLIESAAVLAVAINKIPNVVVTVREGARSLDKDLDEMAQVYRLNGPARLRHVVLPQLAPYLLASARSGLALIWKIVLVVELLGRSDGVGFQLSLFFQMFDVAN
ncbi:MAG TPA: ABC transporter permease, partial [Arenicellales bacterium]|nr:ABC transporter permease [Arenicellales bacterium]